MKNNKVLWVRCAKEDEKKGTSFLQRASKLFKEALSVYDKNAGSELSKPVGGKENSLTETQKKIAEVCDSLKEFLIEKNKRYGNSALEPLKIFGDFDALDLLKIRITDKLMRIKNSDTDRFNDYADLLGYIVLICVSKNWGSFRDLID